MKQSTPPNIKTQRGVVLLVALIMLIIMSILGITSVRTVALEEKMSGAAYDRSIAMQAAEAALLAGEQDAKNKTNIVIPDPLPAISANPPTVNNGFVSTPSSRADNWMVDGVDWTSNAQTRTLNSSVNLGSTTGAQPRYLIEYRGLAACKPDLSKEKAIDNDECRSNPNAPACNCHLFRITARSQPAAGRAEVFLQSQYTTQ